MRQQSATYDEPVYIAAGYSYVETGDFRLKQDAPPLVATLSGLALKVSTMFGNTLVLDTDSRLWNGRTEYRFAEEFLARAGDARRTLQIARIPVILIGALLALYLYLFGRLLVGDYGALVPLFLFCFDPNMIAHARIVSNDMAVAACFFIAHYYFYRLLTEGTRASLIATGGAVALTTVAKFSGLLIVPSLMLVTGFFYLFPSVASLPPGGNAEKQRKRLRRVVTQALAVSTAATIVVISVLYQSPAGVAQYVSGVRSIYTNGVPSFQFYLWGQFSEMASWYYYLAAMLVKTPDVTLVVLAIAVVSALVWRTREAGADWLLIPVVLVLIVCSQDPVTLGLRRVLFVYPFLFLWSGVRLSLLWERWWPMRHRGTTGTVFAAGLSLMMITGALAAVVTAVRIHPSQLAYFNWLAGGPAAGSRYLDDSNIDWGQDLPALAAWQTAHGVHPLALSYFGTDDPARYGIDSRPMRDDELLQPDRMVYAVSVNVLIGLKLRAQESGRVEVDWLARYTPAATIGYSINLYDFR